MSPNPHTANFGKIAVREFAKVIADGNVKDDAVFKREEESENECKETVDCDDQYSSKIIHDDILTRRDDDDEIDEPVSPPPCREGEYPQLIFSSHKEEIYNGLFHSASKKLSSLTPIQQQKILHLKSQLLRLPPAKLDELNTALKNHIRKVQGEQTA